MSEDVHHSHAELAVSRHANEVRVSFIYNTPEDAEVAFKELNGMRLMHGAITITIFDRDILQQNAEPGKAN